MEESQNTSNSTQKQTLGKSKSKTTASKTSKEPARGPADDSCISKTTEKTSKDFGAKSAQPNDGGNLVGHTDLKDSLLEGMKQGFQEIASMLQSAHGAKRSVVDSDSENSSSETQQRVSRSKKHKGARFDLSDFSASGSSDIDVDAELAALLKESSPDPSQELKQKGVLDDILQEFELEEAFSAPVDTNLASIVNKLARSKMSDDKLKEKLNKYNRPQNCEKLITPKVNSEIWAKISSSTRSRDVKLQKIQTMLMKATTVLVGLADKLVKNEKDNSTVKSMFDSIAFISHANIEISHRRRDFIKPDLNKAYQQICSDQVEITDNLFGDDLPQKIKDINATNKVGNTLLDKKKHSKSYHYDNRKHYSSKNEGRSGWKTQTSYNKYQNSQRQYNYPSKKKEGEKGQK
ncbi:uncharacterized protein LOC114576281 [Exaiptasia diaphana]|uniref:Uncharacterized protein n=1 Tax=Exaiptasia diaphana TaxID=2652724 RepID=A0A913YV46_EXADI|nr:uncharacterized protein LOC114576281 [Exaiptasia diaphana]